MLNKWGLSEESMDYENYPEKFRRYWNAFAEMEDHSPKYFKGEQCTLGPCSEGSCPDCVGYSGTGSSDNKKSKKKGKKSGKGKKTGKKSDKKKKSKMKLNKSG